MHHMRMLDKYGLISDQVNKLELGVILREFERILRSGAWGSVVEFGCYEGTSSLYIARLLREYADHHYPLVNRQLPFHVYDSFAGLPEKTAKDSSPAGEQFKVGSLRASKKSFIKNFFQAGLDLPVIHKAWFGDLKPADIPRDIIFAFLDGDFYESIMKPLSLIADYLVSGAVIVVDDYHNIALPGVRRAVDEWSGTAQQNGRILRLHAEASLAIIHLS